ncbi:MAG TPA: molybdenum ABC transporter substrate-binding protein [Acetobacteraceae bacterium]|jgi:molybdate transport system substrate-binding protein|nr:molybdenum ABC transporter substrate-binding protein [Acetobacteraceae bacterium]
MACLILAAPASAAELTVLTAGAFKDVAAALIPAFEARTGDRVTLRNDTVGALVRRINGGETFDVVVMSPAGLRQIDSRIASGSPVDVAKVGVGVAVKAGAPQPDIGTVAGFKAAMLNARAVAYIDPASGGSSGIYVAKLFQTLGIADAMAPKSVLVKGGLAAEAVADGRADIVVHQISEILAVPGVTLIGPLPPDIQNETIYAGAVAADAPDTARAFLGMLSGPDAKSVLSEKGMSPP